MSSSKSNASPTSRLWPAGARLSFGALRDLQLRGAGARKLLADDETAGEMNISQDRLEVGASSRAERFRDVDECAVLIGRRVTLVEDRVIARSAHWSDERPNQPPEPTVMSVTPRADARVAPATTVAHL